MKRVTFIMELIALAILASVHVGAQTDYLDNSFGVNGKVITDFGGSVVTRAAQIMADGKILVAGQYLNGDQIGLALVRYLPNGELDESFGNAGIIISPLWSVDVVGTVGPMLFQSDGKLVVNLYENQASYLHSRLLRFNSDGTQDFNFGDNGSVLCDFVEPLFPSVIYQQPDGKLLVGGAFYTTFGRSANICRFMPDGSVDLTFGNAGQVISDIMLCGNIKSFATQNDDKILVSGDCTLSRYLANGQIDTTFANEGVYFNADIGINDVAILDNDKIVVAGQSLVGGPHSLLMRFQPDGIPDVAFGFGGMILIPFEFGVVMEDILILPDGKLLMCGAQGADGDFGMLLNRYQSDGSLDSTFGNYGYVWIDSLEFSRFNEVIRLTDGDLLVVGSAAESDWGITLAKLHPEGSYNNGFGIDGRIYTYFGCDLARAHAVVVQPDHKILVSGIGGFNIALARYLPDGAPDTTFGDGGKLIPNLAMIVWPNNQGIVLQQDGKIVISGNSFTGIGVGNFSLARFESDGSEDISFGNNGLVEIFLENASVISFDVIMQSDGKLLVGGRIEPVFGPTTNGLVRVQTNGMVDTTFGTNGWVYTNVGIGMSFEAFALAIQPDDKILMAGINTNKIVIVRFLANGMPDVSFGLNGQVVTPWDDMSVLYNSIALQPDGKIVVAATTDQWIVAARYLPNGNLDNTFGTNGKFIYEQLANTGVRSVHILPNGNIAITASAYIANDTSGFVVLQLNSNGTIDTSFGADGLAMSIFVNDRYAYSATIQPDGKVIQVGGGAQSSDFIVIRYKSTFTTGLSNIENGELRPLHVLPNPAAETTRIEGNFPTGSHITVSDAKGRLVYTERLVSPKNQVIFQVHNWQQGLYMIQVREPNGQLWFGKLVVVR